MASTSCSSPLAAGVLSSTSRAVATGTGDVFRPADAVLDRLKTDGEVLDGGFKLRRGKWTAGKGRDSALGSRK